MAQDERDQRMAALGRMLAGIVHDIGTPLGAIRSNNDVMRRLLDSIAADPAGAAERIQTARDLNATDRAACERIAGLVRAVKTLARGEDTEPSAADLNELLNDAVRLVQHDYRGRIALELDLGEVPAVRCVPQEISQVLLNLLVNAGQAVDGKGNVRVRSRAGEGFATISISDTGRGIPPEHRESVFRDGFTTKPPGVGAGLGLGLAKRIVERHRGTIDFESEPGVGTSFHVRLPVEGGRR